MLSKTSYNSIWFEFVSSFVSTGFLCHLAFLLHTEYVTSQMALRPVVDSACCDHNNYTREVIFDVQVHLADREVGRLAMVSRNRQIQHQA